MRKKEDSRVEARLGHMQATVKAAGIKLTHQRLEIFREIAASAEHPDVETVFRAVQVRMPTVSQDTVYRTLWLLRDLGLAATLGPQREGVRFDANLDPHHHYVCVSCGLVRDFESAAIDDLRLPDAVKQLGTIVDAHVEVRGVCATCARPNAVSTKKKAAKSKQSKQSKKAKKASEGAEHD
jgi:Fur family peroxide stress response transcriptional regulator